MLAGGLVVLAFRPEIRWLGCAALPNACLAAASPEAVAVSESGVWPALAEPAPGASALAGLGLLLGVGAGSTR